MDRDDQPPPPRTPKKKGKAPEQPGTPSGEVPPDTGPAPPNSLAACEEAGDIYTVKLDGANGGVVGLGETGGLSADEIKKEVVRARDTPPPTDAKPCVKPTTEQYPHVADPNWLGDGPGPDHYKYESETSKELREQSWTVGVLLIFLRMQYWLIKSRGFRPMCCLCIGVLFLISMKPLVRAVFQAAFGTLALADGIPVLVFRPLFEALVNEAVRRMRIHKLQPSTLIGVTSDTKGGVFVGNTKEGADTSSRDSNGVASGIQTYVRSLTARGLGFRAYADVTVYYTQDGDLTNKKRYDALLDKTGADAKFVASSVDPSLVAIALLELGAAGNKGRISILMPVWCSELGGWVRARYVIGRSLVDTHVQPSDEFCAGALAAAETMAAAENKLKDVYFETGLVYNAKSQNGRHAMIVGEYAGRGKGPKKLRKDLRSGFKYGPEMAEAAEKVLGEVAAANGGVSIEDIHKAAKEAGHPSVKPNAGFNKKFRVAFDQFLGAVGKKLHKVGCMGSINTTKGKRAAEGDSSGSLGTGGKTGAKKPRAKKPRAQPYGPKGRMANPLDMMQ